MISPTSPVLLIALIFIASFVFTLILTGLLLSLLRSHKIFDIPNKHSSHTVSVPRGGGIAVVSVLTLAIWAINYRFELVSNMWLILLVMLLLALLSWIDDISKSGINFRWRLISYFIAATTAILLLPTDELILQGLVSLQFDRVIAIVALVWFMHLFNLMDGIDGIAAGQMSSIGVGVFLLFFIAPLPEGWGLVGLVLIGVSLGFFYWNWAPASIVLGDVGSIPLGFLIGFLLIKLAALGFIAPVILLTLYYLVEGFWSYITHFINKRSLFKDKIENGCQKAIDAGLNASQVVIKILCLNCFLIGMALLSLYLPWLIFFISLFLTVLFVFYLRRGGSFLTREKV